MGESKVSKKQSQIRHQQPKTSFAIGLLAAAFVFFGVQKSHLASQTQTVGIRQVASQKAPVCLKPDTLGQIEVFLQKSCPQGASVRLIENEALICCSSLAMER